MKRENERNDRVARSRKIKRPNLAISSFKKGQILKLEKRPNFQRKFTKIYQINFEIS
jgi:hypothetical protein